MTTATPETPGRKFTPSFLPWMVAAIAFAFYGLTLNSWMNLDSLTLTAQVAGWDGQPMVRQPALFLATYPLRWLPAAQVPVALNLFSAVCAALTLALLARSVLLLPQDRIPGPRTSLCDATGRLAIAQAWLPAALAVVGCGLQLTFWEHATAGTGENFDLLLFAASVWSLLEFRVSRRQVWLDGAALVAGIGMANSWALCCFLPLFLVAVVWLKGLSFFRVRFLARMVLIGLAGVSLLLLLPARNGFDPESPITFGQTLRGALGYSKLAAAYLWLSLTSLHRAVGLAMVLVALVPLLLMSIRWKSFDRTNTVGIPDFTNITFQCLHAVFLAAGLAIAFDPPFSPRQLTSRLGVNLPFLIVYYLSALSVGYFSGFVLAGAMAPPSPERRRSRRRRLAWVAPKLAGALLGLLTLGLLAKNLPVLRAANRPFLRDFGELAVRALPAEGAVVLSDDFRRLLAVQAVLAGTAHPERFPPVLTTSLPFVTTRAALERRFPRGWLDVPPQPGPRVAPTNSPLSPVGVIRLLATLSRSNRLYFLHPCLGLYGEQFWFQPRGGIFELGLYAARQLNPPPPTPAELQANEAFWDQAEASVFVPLRQTLAEFDPQAPGWRRAALRRFHLSESPPATAQTVAAWYSSAASSAGVLLQRAGHLREAGRRFAQAVALNPENLVARLNLQCNSNLLAGVPLSLDHSLTVEKLFGNYRDWNQIMSAEGLVDAPELCFQLGEAYAKSSLVRQATQQFQRAAALAPGDLPAQFALAAFYRALGDADGLLQITAKIRTDPVFRPLRPADEVRVACLEASANFAKTNAPRAGKILDQLLAAQPKDPAVLRSVADVLITYGAYAAAAPIVKQQLQLTPDDPLALINQGYLCIQTGAFADALAPLNRALSLTNSVSARFDRAIALLRCGRLDEAEADYRSVKQTLTNSVAITYGLAEIAYRRRDTNAAIQYYRDYLALAPAETEEARLVRSRLEALQGRGP